MEDNYIGINALNHEASISVVNSSGEILYASMVERYSKIKNDKNLDLKMFSEISEKYKPKKLFWFEDPVKTKIRKFLYGQNDYYSPKKYLKKYTNLNPIYTNHHLAHAASGFATSKFDEACVLVLDGVGEFFTTSVWYATFDGKKCKYKKIWEQLYPNSLGLFYSAFTQRVGLKPNEEEYIMMGMSAFGKERLTEKIKNDFFVFSDGGRFNLREFVHTGIGNYLPEENVFDISYSAQKIFEEVFERILESISHISKNFVYVGGCALNCLANRLITKHFDNVWIFPNPGDGGLSLGCIAAKTKMKLNWNNCFLGFEIGGEYPIKQIIDCLMVDKVVGVANGKSEFGPRALGNRSLFADPREEGIKDRVNSIKKRQEFRPFSPIIKIENLHKYFSPLVNESQYMQFVFECKFPKQYPSICHVDGTSRVQTVSRESNQNLWNLLDCWENKTGCPMILNTSLNIKGKPIVNDKTDAKKFELEYGIRVL